jgi:hypothetical protein
MSQNRFLGVILWTLTCHLSLEDNAFNVRCRGVRTPGIGSQCRTGRQIEFKDKIWDLYWVHLHIRIDLLLYIECMPICVRVLHAKMPKIIYTNICRASFQTVIIMWTLTLHRETGASNKKSDFEM